MKHIGLLLGLLLILSLFTSGAYAAILFDGFENGGTLNSGWIMLPGYGANGVESTEKPYSGTYSMLLTASPQAGSMRKFDQNYYGKTIVFNAWFYHVSGGTDFGGLAIKDDKNVNIAFAYKWLAETMLYGTGAGSTQTGTVNNDAWYRFSIRYDAAARKIDYNVYNTSLTLVASALNVDYYSGDGGNGYYPYRVVFLTSDGGKSYADDVNWGADSAPVATDANITFNIYQAGTSTHLTGVTIDWNNNAYDLTNQSSPVTQDVNLGTYLVSFSKSGYDSNNNFLVVADGNKSYNIYLNNPCAPPINTDWNISTQIDCNFQSIDLGTGKLIISPGGRLRLYDSNVITDQLKLAASGNLIYVFSRSFIKIK